VTKTGLEYVQALIDSAKVARTHKAMMLITEAALAELRADMDIPAEVGVLRPEEAFVLAATGRQRGAA